MFLALMMMIYIYTCYKGQVCKPVKPMLTKYTYQYVLLQILPFIIKTFQPALRWKEMWETTGETHDHALVAGRPSYVQPESKPAQAGLELTAPS